MQVTAPDVTQTRRHRLTQRAKAQVHTGQINYTKQAYDGNQDRGEEEI